MGGYGREWRGTAGGRGRAEILHSFGGGENAATAAPHAVISVGSASATREQPPGSRDPGGRCDPAGSQA